MEEKRASSDSVAVANSNPHNGDLVLDLSDLTNDLSFRAVAPVNVLVQNLNVGINASSSSFHPLASFNGQRSDSSSTNNDNYKTILQNVNAYLPTGSVTAIIGSSGSGKTSVLNALAHRIGGRGKLKAIGSILYNGSPKLSSVRSAYVMQQDVLLPTLTVRETLRYAAELRLPPPTTVSERRKVVEDVILELGLKECADTRVGNSVHKGCSGGEKRRTSLAVQMLANPSILFLDEVTTGLDASTAFQLVRTLRCLARKGRTIIVTIHQPRSEIWSLFDRVLLLAGGKVVYSGPTGGCLPWFERLGYGMPSFVNPAEFVIDLVAVDIRTPEAEAESAARVERLHREWDSSAEKKGLNIERAEEVFMPDTNEGAGSLRPNEDNCLQAEPKASGGSIQHHAGMGRQINILTKRTVKTTWRDPMGMAGIMLEATSMAVITGWIFLQLGGSLQGIRSREGAVYTASALQGYLILLFETYRLTIDIQLFDREYGEGVVSVPAFLISRRCARIIEDIPVPLIFSTIFYFMVGFRPLAAQFFQFYGITLLTHYIAVTLAIVCIAVSRDFAVASLVANMAFTLQSFACGYFVQANQIPIWLRWTKWTAYTFYAFGALSANEFIAHTADPAGQLYACPEPGGTSNPDCQQYTGAYIMQSLGFPPNWISRPIWVLLGFVIAFFLGAGLILQFKKNSMGISRARKSDTDLSAGKEKMAEQPFETRKVAIKLQDYSLDIEKRSFKKFPKVSILKSLNADFQPSILNVIMGPSGSGKSSLLNLMARRLHNSSSTKYISSGRMTINGAIPSDKVVRSICSYVSQDDDALLPYLTVRENLRFAAGLRLPAHLSKLDKTSRADSVLLKMGLRDCADNLIGSDTVKGISGGEKRRVTIGIQILTDPRILFLDEPTSGLDAFTASSIVEVLRGLAQEGRTLVLTIHQSRSDLFKYFNTVLLLARGGAPVYAGPGSQMLSHFASLGFNCPRTTNPADFALDLITVNLQSSSKEERSREKVRSLISTWANTTIETDSALERTASHIATPAELGSFARTMTPFRIAFPLLLHRSSINFRRNPTAIIARTTQVLGFAIVVTVFFAPLKSDEYSVQSRLGFIQEFSPLYFVGMLQCVAVFPAERDVFYHEHDDGSYSVEAFFLQYTLAEVPFEFFTSLLFAVLTVMAAGLDRTAKLFFIVAFNAFAIVSCGESLGIMFNTLVTHTGFAVNLTSVFLSVSMLMGGVMSLHIPAFLQAFNHLSPIKWSLGNLAPYTLRGVVFSCSDDQKLPNGQCQIATGEDALRLYGFDGNDPGLYLLALGICVVVYRIVAFLILKTKRTTWDWKERFGRTLTKNARSGKKIDAADVGQEGAEHSGAVLGATPPELLIGAITAEGKKIAAPSS